MFRILFIILLIYNKNCFSQLNIDTTVQGKVVWNYINPETKLLEKGVFINGHRHGYWKFYDPIKNIIYKKEKYKNGIRKYTYIYNKHGKIIIYIDPDNIVHKRPDCGC